MSFIVFSDDWGGHPSSCQHLFRVIARSHPTLWVNTVGMRPPRLRLGDLWKAVLKVSRMLGAAKRRERPERGAAPAVCSPLMTPFQRPAWLAERSTRSVVRRVARELSRLGLEDPCIVTTVPNVHEAVRRIPARKVVYYCVDDFSEWPGLDRERILAMEARLLESVDGVVATSRALFERFEGRFPTRLLTHGVDYELFAREGLAEHPSLRAIPKPRVGYYGLIDARTDAELLAAVARASSEVSFVLTGPSEGIPEALRALRNVRFTGPVPYDELPAVVAGWQACLLPYRLNDLTAKINPLKLKEYLATGKPVIAAPLPEALSLLPHLRVAATAAEWTELIRDAVRGAWAPDRRALEGLLRPHGWEAKAAELLRACEGLGRELTMERA